jgi:hypothetical protein
VARPSSSRARQNSTQSNVENGKPRPSQPAPNKTNGIPTVLPELAPQPNGGRVTAERPKEIQIPPKVEPQKTETELAPPASIVAVTSITRKESISKVDEAEPKKETTPSMAIAQTIITTKSGRASKPSTPALATFAEAARARPSRASEGTTTKRSHKKGAGSVATAPILAVPPVDEDASSAKQDDDEEDPLYCYCNAPSYGEMIACDADDCTREWFHLECVGLKVAPKGNGMLSSHHLSSPAPSKLLGY